MTLALDDPLTSRLPTVMAGARNGVGGFSRGNRARLSCRLAACACRRADP
jgi:hypothetical protein